MARVLVVFGSKHGSTAEIAEAIAREIGAGGHEVTCLKAHDAPEPGDFDAVVVGSAVYMRRWQGDAKHWLRRHRQALAARPFWVFSSGPVGDPAKDNEAWEEPPRLMHLAEELGAREHVIFGGRAEPGSRMEAGIPEQWRDRRDWDEIRAWSAGIAAAL